MRSISTEDGFLTQIIEQDKLAMPVQPKKRRLVDVIDVDNLEKFFKYGDDKGNNENRKSEENNNDNLELQL